MMLAVLSALLLNLSLVSETAAEIVRIEAGDRPAAFVDDLRRATEENAASISRVLGFAPTDPVVITLTSSSEEFARRTEGALPEWTAAVAIGNRIVVSPNTGYTSSLNRVLTHELVHVFINTAAGERFVPRWFHEACAQHLSGEFGMRGRVLLVWSTMTGRLMSFDDIQAVFSEDRDRAGLAYDQSLLAVRYLINQHGSGVIADIIDGLRAGQQFPEAFRDGTGLWPSEFEAILLDHFREVYGWRSVYLLIPSVWTSIVMLAVIVYIIKRRRNRELLKNWEVIEAAEKIVNFEDYHKGY